ncbi:LamG-like jellyroll fold domain-containing protein [Blastopirellula marina]|uniref:LamG-like jellyroll fold domain-containing protein n=1 Tax=Blastopirellula marina TaxID=124 RepID=A0A2S8GRW5_9BACT|nr:LamG-like jellyroll fold domain-containing protein [Blastopirellula marina]PQO46764.1 hypothetical protein C5Y93_07995 [Blastopirellula marina]
MSFGQGSWRPGAAMLAVMIVGLTQAAAAEEAKSLGDLTGSWQLLVDDYLIAESADVARTFHPFTKYANNPVIRPDKSWEGDRINIYGTVLPNESGGGYRMWYITGFWTGYAISEDGITWEKPELGLVNKTNLFPHIAGGDHLSQVIHTPWDSDPQKQYKRLTYDYGRSPPNSVQSGFLGSYSPDGIHWTPTENNPVLPDPGDVGLFNWDPHTQRYIGYPKSFAPVRGFRRRSVGFTATTDFEHWPNAELILAPDEYDDRWVTVDGQHTDFYGLNAFPYESMYIGLLWIFRIDDGHSGGVVYSELATSRDGIHWQRQAKPRIPMLPLGEEGTWDDGMIFTPNHPLVEGDEIKLFYGGYNVDHTLRAPEGQKREVSIGFATLRKDGFASLDAEKEPGIITTWPLSGIQGELLVNAEATGGWVKAEVLNEAGEVLPGYSQDACTAISGDGVQQKIVWKEKTLLPERDQPLRLRFVLSDASLYSFKAGDKVTRAAGPAPAKALFTFEGEGEEALADQSPAGGQQGAALHGNAEVVKSEQEAARGAGALALRAAPDDVSELEINGSTQLGKQFTLAAWAKTAKRGEQRLFSNYRGTEAPATGELIFDFNTNSGVLRFTANGKSVYSEPTFIRDSKYHHYAAVYDEGNVRLYVDGVEVAREDLPPVTTHLFHDGSVIQHATNDSGKSLVGIHLTADLRVGEDLPVRFRNYRNRETNNTAAEQLVGFIDDVLVEKRALSPDEIQAIVKPADGQSP